MNVKECHAAFCSHHDSTRTQPRRKKQASGGALSLDELLSLAHQLDALSGARAAYQANVQQFTVPRVVFCIFCRVTFCTRWKERLLFTWSLCGAREPAPIVTVIHASTRLSR
jgi:hypothetical protein